MTTDIAQLAERAWNGEVVMDAYRDPGRLYEVAPGVALITGFGNSIAFRTDAGLVLVDTSSSAHIERILAALRTWDDRPITDVIYTHGHFDHVSGMEAIDSEADARGVPRPRVIAHENVARRFDRYAKTAGYNASINARQFRSRASGAAATTAWQHWRYPDVEYRQTYALLSGGTSFELVHARGETDDHTVIHVPSLGVVCSGDLFTWVSPNAGNPQKVQRYPLEWAEALRAIAARRPEILISSHNAPIFGSERIVEALENVARYLESIVEQTVALLNADARLEEAIHAVQPPWDLIGKPYLRAVYDEPEFVVRNTWRMYGGWWDGNPANLKPAPEAELAAEVAELAGGAARLAERAEALAAAGKLRLACHLAELAGLAAPEDGAVQLVRAAVYRARAASEASLMSRGIFLAAAEAAEAHADGRGS